MSRSTFFRGHGRRTGGRVRACRRGALLGILCLTAAAATARAQSPVGTLFQYQGRLLEAGSPANGVYDFRFQVYDSPDGGSQVGPTVTDDDVFVSTGLFMVPLDFGSVFSGQNRFLEVAVRPGAGTGAYETVSGRQHLAPAPMALVGLTAPWAGVTGKPPGFADDVDNDLLSTLTCPVNQVLKWSGIAWACGPDHDTTYQAAPSGGLQISLTGFISISNNGVTNGRIADSAVTGSKIAANAVTDFHIAAAAVGASEIADSAVGSAHIAPDAVGAADLAPDAVTASEIATAAVGTAEIADGTVARADIGGTEIALYQSISECGSTALTLGATCFTTVCSTPPLVLFYQCNGACVAAGPQQCNTTLRGYLLGTAIP